MKDLIQFLILATFAKNDVEDVREILKDYKQYEDPIKEFRENLRSMKVKILTLIYCNCY